LNEPRIIGTSGGKRSTQKAEAILKSVERDILKAAMQGNLKQQNLFDQLKSEESEFKRDRKFNLNPAY